MRTSAVFIGLLFVTAGISPAQRPSATSAPSNWQLGPPFDLSQQPLSSPTSLKTSPAANPAKAPIVQTTPATSERIAVGKTPYVEGSVWMLTFIKTKAGGTDQYLRSIAASLKPFYDDAKKQNLILDYKILTGESVTDREFNVILMVEYPNMAALDAARERAEPIIDKVIGPTEKRRELAMKRSDIRDIVASKTMREIRLK